MRSALVWLCGVTQKPILKLTNKDYNDHGLSELLALYGSAYNANIKIFNDANLINSPYYYLQQNDVIYVQPNNVKAGNSGIGSSTTIWFSFISIATYFTAQFLLASTIFVISA